MDGILQYSSRMLFRTATRSLRYYDGVMFPAAIARQSDINAAIDDVVKDLSQWIVRIRYTIDHDWNGEWGIFFRVVVTEKATRDVRPNLTFNLLLRLGDRLNWEQLGVMPYFNYRSESEQAQLREPAWA